MRVTGLRLTNVRAIETAEIRFQPGFNLVVGVNGVGKTTILNTLAISLSGVLKHTNKHVTHADSFTVDDIRIGAAALSAECGLEIGGGRYNYLIHQPRESSSPQEKAGMPREQVHTTPRKADFIGDSPSPVMGDEPGGRPLAVLFSTNRAVPSERAPTKGAAAGGIAAAFAGALADRELRLGEFAAWMRVQEALREERPAAARALAAFEDTVERFLPGYRHLHLGGEAGDQLMIDRDATTIPVRQLSDGERGTLALVLDLTRRLAQANPALQDPAVEAEAVILIDEIDLHLHPRWQRQIVRKLITAFPRCQFIATTHSPQVIGEVEHERIQIIADGEVYSPGHSFGVDSSRVLEEIMDANPRTENVQELLARIKNEVGADQFDQARRSLTSLVDIVGDDDVEVTRIRTLLDFMDESQ